MARLSSQKKAWKTNPRIGSEAMLTADFGESFIAYLLSKKGVNVVRASSVGFDLLAVDSLGETFPKNRNICISVKARISKRSRNYRPTIPLGSKKLDAAAKAWNADAWIGVVVGSTQPLKLHAFIFPLPHLPKLRGKAKREDVVAVSELYKNPTDKVTRLF